MNYYINKLRDEDNIHDTTLLLYYKMNKIL